MKDRMLFPCAMVLLAALLAGCAQRALTDTEFRGFCYTNVEKRSSCDTLGICDDFDNNVLSVAHASRAACAKACGQVYDRLYAPNQFIGCLSTLMNSYNLCMKYCNTNYAQ
jgi:hypothetical protein